MSQAPLTPHSLKFIRLVRPLYDVDNPSLIDGYGLLKNRTSVSLDNA